MMDGTMTVDSLKAQKLRAMGEADPYLKYADQAAGAWAENILLTEQLTGTQKQLEETEHRLTAALQRVEELEQTQPEGRPMASFDGPKLVHELSQPVPAEVISQ